MNHPLIASLILFPLIAQSSAASQLMTTQIGPTATLNSSGKARLISDPLRSPMTVQFIPGEVLVKYKSGASATDKSNSITSKRAVRIGSLINGEIDHLRLPAGTSVDDALRTLAEDPSVESVQPNYIYHLLAVPNDPEFKQQWSLNNSAQSIFSPSYTTGNPGVSGDDMGMEKAWDYRTDCSSTVVAVVDTGINYNHEDLTTNMWNGGATYPKHGYNFIENNNDPMDYNGHGTHVSGIIGAAGNNGTGISGVCWKASLMAVRVLDASGAGTTANVLSGLQFAAANGAKVINLSLGMSGSDPALQAEITALSTQNIVLVVAAGNNGTDNDTTSNATYPCTYDTANLICVAALDQTFALASFSNFGANSVHVAAPGANVLSTFAGTSTTTQASFQTGGALSWTSSGGAWAYGARTFSTSNGNKTFDMLLNPSNWDGSKAMYANNLDARTYKTFNLNGASTATLSVHGFYDIASGDALNVSFSKNGGDPFVNGTLLASLTGASGSSSTGLTYDISACSTANCTVGFQLKTEASSVSTGAAFYYVGVEKLSINSSSYQLLDGTSMATPQVAGLASMIFSQNPSYSAADVVTSIKNGGVSLSALADKTTTGKVVNGFGSLSYIVQPTGVTAVAK